jgi:hypothetical protein
MKNTNRCAKVCVPTTAKHCKTYVSLILAGGLFSEVDSYCGSFILRTKKRQAYLDVVKNNYLWKTFNIGDTVTGTSLRATMQNLKF